MMKLTRRRLLQGVLLPAALGTLPRHAVQGEELDGGADSPPEIIDTNVHLFDRLVGGGHGPSRSYSTELAKVIDADLTQAQREKIFGGNLRRLAEPIFRKKGYKL